MPPMPDTSGVSAPIAVIIVLAFLAAYVLVTWLKTRADVIRARLELDRQEREEPPDTD
jgi:hypothetical protein